jgi:hypothetical protein
MQKQFSLAAYLHFYSNTGVKIQRLDQASSVNVMPLEACLSCYIFLLQTSQNNGHVNSKGREHWRQLV